MSRRQMAGAKVPTQWNNFLAVSFFTYFLSMIWSARPPVDNTTIIQATCGNAERKPFSPILNNKTSFIYSGTTAQMATKQMIIINLNRNK